VREGRRGTRGVVCCWVILSAFLQSGGGRGRGEEGAGDGVVLFAAVRESGTTWTRRKAWAVVGEGARQLSDLDLLSSSVLLSVDEVNNRGAGWINRV
jgi:hypothetical protein